jgi:signal transduction histidine kinase
MNPYALPSIITVVPYVVLALTVLLLNPRDRTTRWLGIALLAFAASGSAIAYFHLATTREQATFRNPWPFLVVLPSLLVLIEYACTWFGGAERLREPLLGIPIAMHRWIADAILAIAWVVTLSTDWIIAPPIYNETTGWEHTYGPGYPVFLLGSAYVLVFSTYVLWRGVNAAREPVERRYRRLSFVALVGGLYVGAAVLGFVFPWFPGWRTHAFSMLPILFGLFLLTYAQMRYQFETIGEFSRKLEEKVATRTAELAQANLDLQQAKEVADEANRAKSAFLNTVSHELRTPLTSVVGFAKLIKKRLTDVMLPALVGADAKVERASRQVSENVDIIVAEGERLTTLINDVLDLAKIESGKVEWHMQPVALGEIIQRGIAATTSLSGAKGLAVHTEIDELPTVVGDPDRLIQVLINLLSNAIKFTDNGAITCRARKADGAIEVSVTDTGSGIAPEDQPKVFEQFVQVGDTLTGKPTGTGLGLPICKQIIEHHGGRIWVESVVGRGSTFAFTLPNNGAALPVDNPESMTRTNTSTSTNG